MLQYLGDLIRALVVPMGQMGNYLGMTQAEMVSNLQATADAPVSLLAFTAFGKPWAEGLGPLVTALANFLNSVATWFVGLHDFLITF
jgi:hypothetical protein